MIDLAGIDLQCEERELLSNSNVGGVILFARNFINQKQICDLVRQIRDIKPNLLIAVDQEGGRVQRFNQGFTRLPAMQRIGDLVHEEKKQGMVLCHEIGWLMASEILACGIDISFAPVVDVDRRLSKVIGDRAFSDDPDVVVLATDAYINGMHEAGMAVTAKHFPGHGGVEADSHYEVPIDQRTLAELQSRDLKPYESLATKFDAVMPAHITFPKIDSKSVGFSSYWLNKVLRGNYGFKGLIFSDDLSMAAANVAGTYQDKARLALMAGCDMILVCNCLQGASEVVDYLESLGGIEQRQCNSMMARRVPSWSNLKESNRYLRIVQTLRDLFG
ncbi:MAG: beta-N-acetylhexosaminidase [Cellvibrionales bacterium TMED49]|nr:beta-N-acetylhexosaminidase [Porticoccaceae bacterium]OUU37728.1 MAG: beta-N-acetylhexosaminidase [Cellvibrionales bacterium TMED49]